MVYCKANLKSLANVGVDPVIIIILLTGKVFWPVQNVFASDQFP